MTTTCARCGACRGLGSEDNGAEWFCGNCDAPLEYFAGAQEACAQEHWDPSPSDLAHLRRALTRCNLDAPDDAELARNGVSHMRRVILHFGREDDSKIEERAIELYGADYTAAECMPFYRGNWNRVPLHIKEEYRAAARKEAR